MSRATLARMARNPLYWLLLLVPVAGWLNLTAAAPGAIFGRRRWR